MSKPAREIEAEIIAKVRGRKVRTRGVWWTVRTLIEANNGKYPGDLRTPDGAVLSAEDIAAECCTSAAAVLSSFQHLNAIGLLRRLDSGVWHSRPLARLSEVRRGAIKRTQRWKEKRVSIDTHGGVNCAKVDTPKALRNTPAALRNTQQGASAESGNGCEDSALRNAGPPPPSLSPPYTPSIPSPTPEYPNAAHSAGDVGSDAGENGKPSRKKAKEPKFPPGVWERAVEGWGKAFHHVHRSEFHWNPRQTKGLSEVLQALKGDLGRFEQVAKAWLREPEHGLTKGHPLWQLAVDLNYVESKIAQGTVGLPPSGANGAHATPAERKRTAVEQALERRIAQ